MTATLQSALTWNNKNDVSVTIVCQEPTCRWSIALSKKNAIDIARDHMRSHQAVAAR